MKNIYLIILSTLLFSNSIIAQTDTSFDEKVMDYFDSKADKQVISIFITNKSGENIRIDTVKYYYSFSKKFNKAYYVYVNGEIYQKMVYYKNRLLFEEFYTQGKETKRMIYSYKRPYSLLKIFYFNTKEEKDKIEYYNKKGELCKELHGEEAKNAPLEFETFKSYYLWKRLSKGKDKRIIHLKRCK